MEEYEKGIPHVVGKMQWMVNKHCIFAVKKA